MFPTNIGKMYNHRGYSTLLWEIKLSTGIIVLFCVERDCWFENKIDIKHFPKLALYNTEVLNNTSLYLKSIYMVIATV